VVCLSQQWGGRFKKRNEWHKNNPPTEDGKMDVEYRFDNFDDKALKVLNEILVESEAEIVVSSDWRLHASLEEMQDLYRKYKVVKSPIGFTPLLRDFDEDSAGLYHWKGWSERVRVMEIERYLKDHPEIEKWVAIDDLNMGREGLTNFVLTPKSSEGIKQSGLKEKVLKFLS
jgi:hypothetical protein